MNARPVARGAAAALVLFSAGVALLLTSQQGPFDASTFAFQQYREYSGSITLWPAPTLLTKDGPFLLTRPGKFGATAWVQSRDGQPVRLRGALIASSGDRMLEIEPGSIERGDAAVPLEPETSLGTVELSGEIADGKCYLGVMNPGRGKVHRDCAVRCLSGGAPPVFLARDAGGRLRALLLAGLGRELLDYVAEPVRLRGELRQRGSQLIFIADRASLRRE